MLILKLIKNYRILPIVFVATTQLASNSYAQSEAITESYFSKDDSADTGASQEAIELPIQNVSTFLAPSDAFVGPYAQPTERLEFLSITPEVLINLGKSIWPIIDAGRPVVNVRTDWASAVPEGIKTWESMEGWQTPVAKSFSFKWKTLGMRTIRFDYTVVYTPGGSSNGKGRYLTNVTFVPSKLNVSWGYKFSAQAQVSNIVNVGSSADPIAAMQMVLKWTIDTPVTHHELSSDFYMTGAGEFKDLTRYQ